MIQATSWDDYWSPQDNKDGDDLKDFRDNGHEVMDSSKMAPDLGLKEMRTEKSWETTNYRGIHTPEEAAKVAVRAAKMNAEEFNVTSEVTPLTDEQLANSVGTCTVTYTGDEEYVNNIKKLVEGVSLVDDIKAERRHELMLALVNNKAYMEKVMASGFYATHIANQINNLLDNLIQ